MKMRVCDEADFLLLLTAHNGVKKYGGAALKLFNGILLFTKIFLTYCEKNSNWKKIFVFRNMQGKLEKDIYFINFHII